MNADRIFQSTGTLTLRLVFLIRSNLKELQTLFELQTISNVVWALMSYCLFLLEPISPMLGTQWKCVGAIHLVQRITTIWQTKICQTNTYAIWSTIHTKNQHKSTSTKAADKMFLILTLGSISSTFYKQLLNQQIPKEKKTVMSFLRFLDLRAKKADQRTLMKLTLDVIQGW